MIELIIALAAIVAAFLVGRDSGKKSNTGEVIDNVAKHKEATEAVDNLPADGKREQLRDYVKK